MSSESGAPCIIISSFNISGRFPLSNSAFTDRSHNCSPNSSPGTPESSGLRSCMSSRGSNSTSAPAEILLPKYILPSVSASQIWWISAPRPLTMLKRASSPLLTVMRSRRTSVFRTLKCAGTRAVTQPRAKCWSCVQSTDRGTDVAAKT